MGLVEALEAVGIVRRAGCQSAATDGSFFSFESSGYLKRADPESLKVVFEKYASVKVDGETYMTDEDFIVRFLHLFPEKDYNKSSVSVLCGILDQSKDGLISFSEFRTFEERLCLPDALYRTAFQLFDTNGNGKVSFDEFVEILSKTSLHKSIPFHVENSDFAQLYFGKDKQKAIPYTEFSQFLHDFLDAYATVSFKFKDKDHQGFISPEDFYDIMLSIKSHLMNDTVRSNFEGLIGSQKQISYPYFAAFISLLSDLELIKKIYLNATNGSRTDKVSKEEFMHSAQMMSQITPLEIDILFALCNLLNLSGIHGKIMYTDLQAIAPEQYMKQITSRLTELYTVSSPEERGIVVQILESAYRFALGSIAGACGAAAVYPIDLVKTRMQNQRTGAYIGELMYRNGFDCFKKVIRHEGVLGLYRGLIPQLVGVAPEKAIKLTVNDLVRDKIKSYNNQKLPVIGEMVAGGCAGGSQVLFTNPLEIVKIRLQVAGEIATAKKPSAWAVVKELGFFGLYKGAQACLLRDIPFSAIYFPTYAHLKPMMADENGYNSPLTLLLAGAIAGMPAASLVTPADVIKTRLQVVAREGQTKYFDVKDATRKIYQEEGFKAFWKGSIARMLRSSPQFGVTLFTYELLQRLFYIDFGGSHPSGSHAEVPLGSADMTKSTNPDHIGGYQVAIPIFRGIESKFGLVLPKFSVAAAPTASS